MWHAFRAFFGRFLLRMRKSGPIRTSTRPAKFTPARWGRSEARLEIGPGRPVAAAAEARRHLCRRRLLPEFGGKRRRVAERRSEVADRGSRRGSSRLDAGRGGRWAGRRAAAAADPTLWSAAAAPCCCSAASDIPGTFIIIIIVIIIITFTSLATDQRVTYRRHFVSAKEVMFSLRFFYLWAGLCKNYSTDFTQNSMKMGHMGTLDFGGNSDHVTLGVRLGLRLSGRQVIPRVTGYA